MSNDRANQFAGELCHGNLTGKKLLEEFLHRMAFPGPRSLEGRSERITRRSPGRLRRPIERLKEALERAAHTITDSVGHASIKRDGRGRVVSLHYPNLRKTISFHYHPVSGRIDLIAVQDGILHRTRIFRRQPSTNHWLVTDEHGRRCGIWRGTAVVTRSGVYAFKTYNHEKSEGIWWVRRPDANGTMHYNRFLKNGSVLTYGADRRLSSVRRADGSELKCQYTARRLAKIVEAKDGVEQRSWSRLSSGQWRENDSNKVYNLHFTRKGDFYFSDKQGRHTIRSDGRQMVRGKDFAKVELDKEGRVRKLHLSATMGDGTRIFEYNGKTVSKISSIDSFGRTKVIYPGGDSSRWKNLFVYRDGSFDYTSPEGTTVRWKANSNIVEHNKDGTLRSVTLVDGSKRSFSYDSNKRVDSISDTRKTSTGSVTEIWKRQGLTGKFTCAGCPGERQILRINNDDGKYFYKVDRGPERVSKPNDLVWSNPHSPPLEKARLEFLKTAAERGLDMTRLHKYMDRFEERMAALHKSSFIHVARTYEKLTTLLHPTGRRTYMDADRCKQLAMQTMGNLAYPIEHINQGRGIKTCQTTVLEKIQAIRQPEKYADVITQIALKGEYRSHGRVIRPKPKALEPGPAQRSWTPETGPYRDWRNLASKIWQVTTIASGKPEYISGSPNFKPADVRERAKFMIGKSVVIFGKRYLPSGEQLLTLKEQNQLPCVVDTLSGRHYQLVVDVRRLPNGQVQVYLTDNHGINRNRGWVDIKELHQRILQKKHVPAKPRRVVRYRTG